MRTGRPPLPNGRKSRFDSCACGEQKNLTSVMCMGCYRNGVISNKLRGRLPKAGEVSIYLLRNDQDKVFYVGSTYRPKRRINDHRKVFGTGIVMLIVKNVPESERWREEILATIHYERFIDAGIKSANPANIGK